MASPDPSTNSEAPDGGPLGVVVGGGRLPVEALARLRARNDRVEVFGFEGVSDDRLVDEGSMTRLGQL